MYVADDKIELPKGNSPFKFFEFEFFIQEVRVMTTLYTMMNYEPQKNTVPDWMRNERLQYCDQGIRSSLLKKAARFAKKRNK
jgi:hypothetical protein